jgi:hypothetical protein
MGSSRHRKYSNGPAARKAAIASAPWNQAGCGGMDQVASARSMPIRPCTSAVCIARTYRVVTSRSASSSSERMTDCWLRSGRCSSITRRAR